MSNSAVYLYIRFSTAEQALGHSKERQEELGREYCVRKGLTLSEVFIDEGLSGFTGVHLKGEFGRFLKLVNSGDIAGGSTLLVENLDRLSRQNVHEAFAQLNELLSRDITVVTLSPEKVYEREGDITSVITAVLEMHRSNSESALKAKRLASTFAEKRVSARQGIAMGDVGPGWLTYNSGERNYTLEPQRVAAVKRIFELTISGFGKNTVAKMLNAEKRPVLARRRLAEEVKGWSTSAVHHVVMNRSVLGEWQPMTRTLDPKRKKRTEAGPVILNYFPRIIDDDVFMQAQHSIASRRRDRVTKQSGKVNVWSKVAKCIHCGSAMHMVNKGTPPKGQTYLTCWLGRKGLCKSAKLIRLDHSELIFALMLPRLSLLQLVRDSGARLATRLSITEAKIAETQKAHEQKKSVFEQLPTKDVALSMEKSRVELEDLQAQREAIRAELAAEDAMGFASFMERLDLESRDFREKCNATLRNLGVLAFVGRDGFIVTEGGSLKFGLAYRDGEAGYLELRTLLQPRGGKVVALHVTAERRYVLLAEHFTAYCRWRPERWRMSKRKRPHRLAMTQSKTTGAN